MCDAHLRYNLQGHESDKQRGLFHVWIDTRSVTIFTDQSFIVSLYRYNNQVEIHDA